MSAELMMQSKPLPENILWDFRTKHFEYLQLTALIRTQKLTQYYSEQKTANTLRTGIKNRH
jgi:hypothetical protein